MRTIIVVIAACFALAAPFLMALAVRYLSAWWSARRERALRRCLARSAAMARQRAYQQARKTEAA